MTGDGLLDLPSPWLARDGRSPVFLDYVAVQAGLEPLRPGPGSVHLDVECGSGGALAALAAALPDVHFIGTAADPADAEAAMALAADGGLANLEIRTLDPAALAEADLPACDTASLACLDALAADKVPQVLADVAGRLKPQGLMSVAYLCRPGGGDIETLRRAARTFTAEMAVDTAMKSEAAASYLRYLLSGNAPMFSAHPATAALVEALAALDAPAVAGMLLAPGAPLWFSEVAGAMSACGLAFAGNAELYLNHLDLAVPPGCQAPFADMPDPADVQVQGDIVRNQARRCDVYAKGAVDLDSYSREKAMASLAFGATAGIADFQRAIDFGGVKAEFKSGLFETVISALCVRAWTVKELIGLDEFADFPPGHVAAAVGYLTAAGQVKPFARVTDITVPAPDATWRVGHPVNTVLMERGLFRAAALALAAPNAGIALDVAAVDAALLRGLCDGHGEDLTGWLRGALLAHGQDIVAGTQVVTAEDMQRRVLQPTVDEFLANRLPKYAELGVVAVGSNP